VELLGTILDDLGIERRGSTKGELMTALGQHLLAAGEEGRTVVVILDEAQQMSVEALEQIRILSTLETPTRKLLQIVLAGQPELEARLEQHELRQLSQRIAIRCRLGPLSRKDTDRYIEHRLRVAGLTGALPFTRSALARIYRHTRGVPRLINLLCDRALMAAYGAHAREVTPALVRAAIRNLRGESAGGGGMRLRWLLARPWRPAALAGILVVIVGIAVSGYLARQPAALLAGRQGGPAMAERPEAPAAATPIAPSAAESAATQTPVAPGSRVVASAGPAAPSAGAPPGQPREGEGLPEGVLGLVTSLLRLWGVSEDLSAAAVRGWPMAGGGMPDLVAIARRYQLAATYLPNTGLDELRAIGLPALVEINETGGRRPYLLRRMSRDAITLVAASGAQIQFSRESLEPAWTRSAWIIWRNLDELPADPHQEMSATVVATVALRLQKLGHLKPPLPASPNERFTQAVRRFQREVGLPDDGIIGPRTTLALSRVVAGRMGPSVIEPRRS
jgi:general secretion pathway protein A